MPKPENIIKKGSQNRHSHPCLPFIIFHLENSILRILRHTKLYYRCTKSSALKNFTNLLFCFFSLIHSKKNVMMEK